MTRFFIATIFAVVFASPALASHCPKDVAAIDAALAEQDNAEAAALRDQGQELHEAGNHEEALAALHQAMDMLGLEH